MNAFTDALIPAEEEYEDDDDQGEEEYEDGGEEEFEDSEEEYDDEGDEEEYESDEGYESGDNDDEDGGDQGKTNRDILKDFYEVSGPPRVERSSGSCHDDRTSKSMMKMMKMKTRHRSRPRRLLRTTRERQMRWKMTMKTLRMVQLGRRTLVMPQGRMRRRPRRTTQKKEKERMGKQRSKVELRLLLKPPSKGESETLL